jgi:hypothetical protein
MFAQLLRTRRKELVGLLAVLVAGVVVVALIHPLRAGRPAAGPAQTFAAPGITPVGLAGPATGGNGEVRAATGTVPGDLDAEFAAYSNQSGCADWAGGDGTSAVRMNATQVAWFFSDSYLGPAGPGIGYMRATALIHNSVVVQTTTGKTDRFVTLTGGDTCSANGYPASVVAAPRAPGRTTNRYWAEGGIKIGSSIVEFYDRYSGGNIPYVAQGTVMAVYQVDQLAAAGHGAVHGGVTEPTIISTPYYLAPGVTSPVVWGAAVLQVGGTVYVYGTQTPNASFPYRSVFLARVPAAQLTDWSAWQFYAGGGNWSAAQSDAAALQPASQPVSVSTGFSVVQVGSRYWLVQADPFAGSQDVIAYPAASPWGPFDPAGKLVLYSDPGIGLNAAHDYRIMYEARAETAVSPRGSLVISYNMNSTAISAGCTPMSWFTDAVTRPRFVDVPLTVLATARDPGGLAAAGGTAADYQVTAGPPDYRDVIATDPSQWFNEWSFKKLCPPIPAMTGVTASPRPGGVTLSFPDLGLGFAYRVYLKRPGASGYTLTKTVPWVLTLVSPSHPVRLTAGLAGLSAGQYQVKVVALNNGFHQGQATPVTFTVAQGG